MPNEELGDLLKSLSTCALTSASIERKRETSGILFLKSKQEPVYFYEISGCTKEIRYNLLRRSRRRKKYVIKIDFQTYDQDVHFILASFYPLFISCTSWFSVYFSPLIIYQLNQSNNSMLKCYNEFLVLQGP